MAYICYTCPRLCCGDHYKMTDTGNFFRHSRHHSYVTADYVHAQVITPVEKLTDKTRQLSNLSSANAMAHELLQGCCAHIKQIADGLSSENKLQL